ncbi:C39 family peptidase [Lysobacter sp. cf310]|uniref:C39 family peptidase n=1 Tax=Lysobacter sp. cf310 TaxID=1761790 RepID=UPI0008EF39C0|nr:C39 family peptidase [Lysobacter sp. cf310]SFK48433.1 Peptidase_C39 like family protein [Lysobacter sp. cf310]
MNLKNKLSTALLLALSAAGTASAGVLNVPLHMQEHSNWCWAASATMILQYHGRPLAQCTFVNKAFNINYACGNSTFYWNSPANQGNWNYYVDDHMNYYWGGMRFYQQNGYLSQADLQYRINANKPFIMSWRWSNGGGHDVVVKGYSGSYVYFNDPWDGSYTRTYASTVSAPDRHWEDVLVQY